ncbi:hypothetical protein GOQ04_24730 [Emticicia sp. ODNR4P]|nr:hypothetical protein [Emticicia sp. ODNR4P]
MKQILATLTLDTNGQIVSYQSHGEMTLEEFQAFSEEALALLAKKKTYEAAVINNELKLDMIGKYMTAMGCFRADGAIDFEPAFRPVFEKLIIEWEERKTLMGKVKAQLKAGKKKVASFFVNLGIKYAGKGLAKGVQYVKK